MKKSKMVGAHETGNEDGIIEDKDEESSNDLGENEIKWNPSEKEIKFNQNRISEGEIQQEEESGKTSRNNIGRTDDSDEYYMRQLPLYKAVLRGDWTEANKLWSKNKNGPAIIISHFQETSLHVALKNKSNDFLRKLLEIMPDDALSWQNSDGRTALHIAAIVGNEEAAMMLVNRNPDLLYIPNRNNHLPVHTAAGRCHKYILTYLIYACEKDLERKKKDGKKVTKNPFVGALGAMLLNYAMTSEFIDVALSLVQKYPDLAKTKDWQGLYALESMTFIPHVFPSGASFSWWENWIYSCITLICGDQRNKCRCFKIVHAVPQVKSILDKKLMHQKSLQLLKILCNSLSSVPGEEAMAAYKNSIISATYGGTHEVVEVIVQMIPTAIYFMEAKTNCTIFHLAARQRFESVFNIIYLLDDQTQFFYNTTDFSDNNLMHTCAELAPSHKLNLVPGAALQMQRELQWFKEMEKFVNPSRREWQNKDGYTAKMLFTKEHHELKTQGEKWMKGTANSCTFAAALIATVVYSAAFQVPGGLDTNTGVANFWHKVSFILFAVSDTISLFTSVTSLLMFLSILTSRYAEEDFLYVLPSRLCIGLLTLFISIIFMMVAFGATLYLGFWKKVGWFLLPAAALACLPVISFVFLQFPLLIDVMYSTYGPGIFGKKGKRSLHKKLDTK